MKAVPIVMNTKPRKFEKEDTFQHKEGTLSRLMRKLSVVVLMILVALMLPLSSSAQQAGEGNLPRFGSVTKGANLPVEASLFTGEATTSLPIELPLSAGDIQEKISLDLRYRSGGGNSWVGKGWELEPGYIAKINKFGANSASNPYLLVLNGQSQELVSIATNQYRTKIESYLRIEFTGSAWLVYDRDGTQYRFGISAAGRWLLDKITNTHGISLAIAYDIPNSEEVYLKEIRYPEGSGLSPYCKISFVSENRTDTFVTHYYSVPFRTKRRLKEIQILVDGYVQKRYSLTYGNNGTSQVSLLSSVIEYGKDSQALPIASFSYQRPLSGNIYESKGYWLSDTATEYTYEGGFNDKIVGFTPSGINEALIDLNNDTLPDFIGCKYKSPVGLGTDVYKTDWVVRMNTGTGFSTQESVWLNENNSYFAGTFPYAYEPISLTRNSTLTDMNKDGLPDLVYSKYGGKINNIWPVYDIFVRYNTGTKFSDTTTKILDHTKAYISEAGGYWALKIGANANLIDMNGDGLPDLVSHTFGRYEPIGDGYTSYSIYNWTVRLNTGSGFSDVEKNWLNYEKAYFKYYMPPLPPNQPGGYSVNRITLWENATLTDMNNDGLPDLVYNDFGGLVLITGEKAERDYYQASYNIKVRYNNGTKFSDEAVTYYSLLPVYKYRFYSGNNINSYAAVSAKIGENGIVADINNDSLPDFVFNSYSEGPQIDSVTFVPKTEWRVSYNRGNFFDNSISLFGSLDYWLSTKTYVNTVANNAFLVDVDGDKVLDLVYPQFMSWGGSTTGKATSKLMVYRNKNPLYADLLSNQTTRFGGKADIAYEASDKFDNTAGDGKSDLPFIIPVVKSITRDPGVGDIGTTYYSYEGGWYDIPKREFRGFRRVRATDPLGFVTQTLFHQDDSGLGKVESQENSIAKTLNTYKADTTAPYFTPLIQTDEYANAKVKRTSYDYDSYGNIIKAIFYGDTAASGDEKSVFTDYCLNTSSWLVNLPSRERLFANTDGSGSSLAETQYFYDNHANYTDTPTKGDSTKVRRYLNTKAAYVQATSSYDNYGNEISKADANGNTTNIAYDSTYRSFPITITNAMGHIERTSYYLSSEADGLFGQVKSKTDPNGNTASFKYDGLGRKIKVIGPYDLYSTYGSESYEYEVNGPGTSYILTRTTEENGTPNHLIKVDILDGFERVIQTAKESEDARIYSYITTSYNSRGDTAKVSLPYFEDGGLPTYYSPPGGSVKWAQYVYDAIGRITRITKPDTGTINNSYSGWTTTVTDENNHQKTFIKDAYDRLISVKEKKAAEEYATNYKYDALDNLTLITDHFGNKFEFFYDSLKRKIKMIDPDLGTWTYDYDNNGNVIKSTNAKGVVINFMLDSLNRVVTKDYASQLGIEVTYAYDGITVTNGIGRRTGMQDLSGSSSWNYDKEGRITKLEKVVDGNAYTLEWAYDAMGRIKSILYPNLKSVDFSYNDAGLTESIDGFILDTDYNASYQPIEITFSNPVVTRFDYYPENQRLKSILTGSLQDLIYGYDKVGNITKITDAVRSNIKNYTYDDLDRLISGDANTYEYNAIGNIVKVNGVAQSYSLSKAHALTSDGINTYSYDSCGNMVSGAGRSISYDPENLPIVITKNGTTTQFVYDGDSNRVKKIVNDGLSTVTTVYIADLYEKEIIP